MSADQLFSILNNAVLPAWLLLVIAVPLTLHTLRSNRVNGAARTVLSDIRLAQSMAATRGGKRA